MTKILIVDDHVSFAEMLDFALRPALANDPETPEPSPKFVHANSVTQGLRLVSEEGPFDLAVVDLILPDGDGIEVVKEIKSQSPNTAVVVLSARHDVTEPLAAGADEVISKRAPLAEIVASLVRLVRVTDRSDHPDA